MTATAASASTTLTIARHALKTALGKLATTVYTSSKALPAAQHIRFDIAPGRMTLTATDFETFVRLSVPCDAIDTATVLLPAKRLTEIVSALPPVGAVTIVVSDRRAVLTAGRSRFEMVGLAAEEFPMVPIAAAGKQATVHAARFVDTIARALPHASTEATARPAMCVVRLEPADDRLLVLAVDGRRFIRLTAGDWQGDTLPACSLPRTAPAVLGRLFAGLADEATLTLALDEYRLTVSGGDAMATLRLVDLAFPDVAPQLRVHAPTHIVHCDRLLLSAAVRRVALAADGEYRRVAITIDDEITLHAAGDALGSATDVVLITERRAGAGDGPVRFGINAAFALTALDTLTGNDVAIEVTSPTHPIVLTEAAKETGDPTLALVMPLRLKA